MPSVEIVKVEYFYPGEYEPDVFATFLTSSKNLSWLESLVKEYYAPRPDFQRMVQGVPV